MCLCNGNIDMKSTQFVCHNSFQRVVNLKKNIRALVVLSVDWVNDTPLIIYTSFSVLTSKQGWTYLIYCLQPKNFSHQLPYKNTLNSLRSNICNGQEIHIPNFFLIETIAMNFMLAIIHELTRQNAYIVMCVLTKYPMYTYVLVV